MSFQRQSRRVRVGIGLRDLTPGGVTRLILNLIEELSQRSDRCTLVALCDLEVPTDRLPGVQRVVFPLRGGALGKLYWDFVQLPLEARRQGIECLICPNNIIPPTHFLFQLKRVNFVYDLAYFDRELKEYKALDTLYMRSLMGFSCRASTATVTISHATKEAIVSRLGVSAQKIRVIYPALDPTMVRVSEEAVIEESMCRLKIKRPYFFYCGSLSPRKNMYRTLRAFQELRNRIPHMFYLAGGLSWNDKPVTDLIDRELSDRVIRLGPLSDTDLRVMYSGASLFLYPSVYEGFGLPILEAQACECPVLTSSISSCPEAAGEGACLVDPRDVDQIRDGILKIVEDKAYRTEIIARGCENLRRFSWRRSAESLLTLIEGLT